MLSITIDIEWSPDEIVDDCLEILERAQVPATLFCTDPSTDRSGMSSSLAGRYSDRLELALHPNFDRRGDYDVVFDSLLGFYPDARGYRSHNCVCGWPITLEAVKRGLRYESNYVLYGEALKPAPVHADHADIFQYPVYFMDAAMLSRKGYDWETLWPNFEDAANRDDMLLVFDFHPVMLYYDCRTQADYLATKDFYHQPRPQLSHRKRGEPAGSMKMFAGLVERFDPGHFRSIRVFHETMLEARETLALSA